MREDEGMLGKWGVESGEWGVRSEEILIEYVLKSNSPLPTHHSPLSTLHSPLRIRL